MAKDLKPINNNKQKTSNIETNNKNKNFNKNQTVDKHWKNAREFNDDNDDDEDDDDEKEEKTNKQPTKNVNKKNNDSDDDDDDNESEDDKGDKSLKKRKISEFENDKEDEEESDKEDEQTTFESNKPTINGKPIKVPKGARKYLKGEIVAPTGIKNPYMKTKINKIGELKLESAKAAQKMEMLLQHDVGFIVPENDREKTYKLTQNMIASKVDIQSSAKVFDLALEPNGPYKFQYSKNGRYLLLAGASGHFSMIDWQRGKKFTERHLGSPIRDAVFLQNETMFALAQKKYTYIYNQDGVEMHWLKDHYDPKFLDYLPYHFLLVSATNKGKLIYEDISVGQKVVESFYHGPLSAMCKNPQNGVMNLGFSTGIVQMWIPKSRNPIVKIHCHKSPITSMAVSLSGNHLVTSGLDGMIKIFDLRNTYEEMHSFATRFTPNAISLSDTNVLAVAGDKKTFIWKNPFDTSIKEPYLVHQNPSYARNVQFCPFEDVLGIGTESGFSSILVPGSGIANYDSMEADPFASKKMKREQDIKALLEKIPHDMITLDPNVIGTIQQDVKTDENKHRRQDKPRVDRNRQFDPKKLEEIKQKNKERKEKLESEILNPSSNKSALSRFERK
ncbi:hypothetical protein RB653_005630 [Dictyostelium firmibasis]|uniref:BING4 C-terminal domain-containing protein n=1 Tax=Dictyostelium firmibasis TaxID=79012 RepID=A0AAN7UBU2_9MYCE